MECPVGKYFVLEVMVFFTVKPTCVRRLYVAKLPHKYVYQAICCMSILSFGIRDSRRAVMSMPIRVSPCVMRAERRSGRLISVLLSMVLMFQHALDNSLAPFEEAAFSLTFFKIIFHQLFEKITTGRSLIYS